MENDAFETIKITDWTQVYDLPEVKHGTAFFRGQANDTWGLKTSLEREFERLEIHEDNFLHKERALLAEFRRRAHLYIRDLPDHDDVVGWLALMQHHGAPTRLLDFSYSFFVACHFAFSTSSGDSAIWAIDDLWLRTCLDPQAYLREESLNAQVLLANKKLSLYHEEFKGGGRPKDLSNAILMIEPTRQIQRLAVQQGLFLMSHNLHENFITNLVCMAQMEASDNQNSASWFSDTKKHFKKIVFTKEAGRFALRELRKMNITAESLFPGMDGFAESLKQTVLAV